jgi:hypothetical protein
VEIQILHSSADGIIPIVGKIKKEKVMHFYSSKKILKSSPCSYLGRSFLFIDKERRISRL